MAQIIPITLTDLKYTRGEKIFFDAIKEKLPVRWYAWFNMGIHNKEIYPDFIILDPEIGILTLEVKDWSIDGIAAFSRDRFTLKSGRSEKNPIATVRDYSLEILKVLNTREHLLHTSGPYKGKFTFLWDYGCVFPNISRKDFRSFTLNGLHLSDVIDPNRVILKEDIELEETDFIEKIRSVFEKKFIPNSLTKAQFFSIRQAICPETVIAQRNLLVEHGESKVKIDASLDAPQEAIAKSIGEGHRLLQGIAGSGKTLIMLFRAKLICKLQPKWNILFLCWNISIGSYLRQMFDNINIDGDFSNVKIYHFSEWVRQLLEQQNIPIPSFTGDNGDDKLLHSVNQLLEKQPKELFDSIFVDEAQDMQGEYIKLLVKYLNPKTNNLLICADEAQNILGRSWKALGVNVDSKDRVIQLNEAELDDQYSLRMNYRNTKEIISFAANIYDNLLPSRTARDEVTTIQLKDTNRKGSIPTLERFTHRNDEIHSIANWILQLKEEKGLSFGDFLVVFPSSIRQVHELIESIFLDRGIPYYLVAKSFESKAKLDLLDDTVKVSTIGSAKGMDFIAVLFVYADLTIVEKGNIDKPRLYTACTRARDYLYITYKERSTVGIFLESIFQKTFGDM